MQRARREIELSNAEYGYETCIRVIPAGCRSTDIHLMSFDSSPGKQLVVVKNRLESSHIGILVTAGKDVVVQDHISRMNVITEIFNDLAANRLQSKSQHRFRSYSADLLPEVFMPWLPWVWP